MRNAFVGAGGNLKAHGFVQVNDPDDMLIEVAEDFDLEPGKWRWDGADWRLAHEAAAPDSSAP